MGEGGLSIAQERVLAILPKCSASLGMPSALFLIYELCFDQQRSRSTTIHRALLGMSVIDVLSSSAWFLSTWAVPKGSFALSAGNRATCSYQGFLLQLAIGAPLYNSSLALFYLLMIKYNWTDSMLQTIEKWVHLAVLTFSVGTAIVLLPLRQYNQIGAVCWVIGDPEDCGSSSFQGGDEPCKRGDHAWIYGLALFYGPLWFCVILCVYSMCLVYQQVRVIMKRGHRHSLARRTDSQHARSEAQVFAMQAILYTLSFLITWMPSTMWSIAHWFQFSAFWLDVLASICEPLQGFWNVLIFSRNRHSTRRKLRYFLSVITFGVVTREEAPLSVESAIGQRSSIARSSTIRNSFLRAMEFRTSSVEFLSSIVAFRRAQDGDDSGHLGQGSGSAEFRCDDSTNDSITRSGSYTRPEAEQTAEVDEELAMESKFVERTIEEVVDEKDEEEGSIEPAFFSNYKDVFREPSMQASEEEIVFVSTDENDESDLFPHQTSYSCEDELSDEYDREEAGERRDSPVSVFSREETISIQTEGSQRTTSDFEHDRAVVGVINEESAKDEVTNPATDEESTESEARNTRRGDERIREESAAAIHRIRIVESG